MQTRPYRWQRRAAQKARRDQKRQTQSFWIFQLVLMALIFWLWSQFVPMFALASAGSPCIERFAAFGTAKSSTPVFTQFSRITYLGLLLWFVIAAAHKTVLRKTIPLVFTIFMAGCFLMVGFLYRAISPGNLQPPDGVIMIGELVIDKTVNPPVILPAKSEFSAYTSREFGEGGYWYSVNSYQFPSCVWLDENSIAHHVNIEIPGYAAMSETEQIKTIEEYNLNRGIKSYDPWRPSIGGNFKTFWKMTFSKQRPMEVLAAEQSYRAMRPEERERLLLQNECRSAKSGAASHADDCMLFLKTDYNAYYEDRHIRLEFDRVNALR